MKSVNDPLSATRPICIITKAMQVFNNSGLQGVTLKKLEFPLLKGTLQ